MKFIIEHLSKRFEKKRFFEILTLPLRKGRYTAF